LGPNKHQTFSIAVHTEMADMMSLKLDQIVGDETYHLRNPLLPAQPLRAHKPAEWDESEKSIQNIRHQSQKQNSAALLAELESLGAEIEGKIQSLSLKYSKKETFVRDQILSISSFKPQRRTSLFNAEVSVRARELRDSKQS
jgi:hypothetical protein